MKTHILLSLLLTISITGFSQAERSGQAVTSLDSVVMGPGYANDIYYSFENGVVSAVPRTNWDIGFYTKVMTAGIITNGAAGVNLYTYPKADTTGWNTVDTSGISSWPIMYDNEKDWEDGAFNRNASGHPDYGWGIYNIANHDVVGDSLYILKSLDGAYRKIWIIRKNSSNNIYFIRSANLDGSDDKVKEFDINPYRHANFVYYSFSASTLLDREPDTASWDILFTKYMAIQPDGTPYSVVGVLDNFKVYANKFYPVAPDFTSWTDQPLDSAKSPIGFNWKTINMETYTWSVEDSTVFFVQTRNKDIYKLVFNTFDGSSTGRILFEKSAVSPSGITLIKPGPADISVYPNPVKDQLNVVLGDDVNGNVFVSVYDLTGRQVYSAKQEASGNILSVKLPESTVCSGMHLLKVETGKGIYTSKFMVTKY
jgi:hypothetical protein